ncbi:eukaryotic translation initiation factor 5A-1-like [Anneissia japonica]|uniref:eukaryotic translation initiation factor 5A-1-like n=1 Tax=Anneissia japonica TaxID=1529436 RepID=UPI00142585BF|nr:eukaryotic translation initiation factor 5A-1-like [Anneissia japonica]
MESELFDYEHASSGAASFYPAQCSSLKKGGYVIIKKRPCKVVELSTSKPGKHGHAKVNYVGLDVFTGRKYTDCAPSSSNVHVPNVKKGNAQLIGIGEDDFAHLLISGRTKDDIRVPDGSLGDDVRAIFDQDGEALVTILSACDEEAIVAVKACPPSYGSG